MTEPNSPAVRGPLDATVVPHSGDWMTVREAERLCGLWCAGQPLDDLPQWRTAMQVLARALADTRAALTRANDQAEHFEREWYLRGDALDKIAERTGSDDPCRELVQIARDALRHNVRANLEPTHDDA